MAGHSHTKQQAQPKPSSSSSQHHKLNTSHRPHHRSTSAAAGTSAPPQDDDETDEDVVETLCALCSGSCRCGGADGKNHTARSSIVASTSAPKPSPSNTKKRGRPTKDLDAPYTGSHTKKKSTAASSKPSNVASTASTKVAAPVRMSLRAALAASVKDANLPSSAPPSPELHMPSQVQHDHLSDVSDLDLEDDEDESDIERAEERALRQEFESEEEGRERKRRKGSKSSGESDFNSDVDEDQDFPQAGGKGVVTWSDYDSVDGTEEADFDDELEELIAVSDAIIDGAPPRPLSRADSDDISLSEMWFEGSDADDESSSSDDDDDDEDEDERNERTLVIMDRWAGTRSFSSDDGSVFSDSELVDSSSSTENDGGDTTDSLDSDDHVGLVRFGIEVDDASSSGGEQEDMTPAVALADVQAPTKAESAYLWTFRVEYEIGSIVEEDESELAVEAPPKKQSTSSSSKRRKESAGSHKAPPKGPAMGVFAAEGTRNVVIDESDKVAPSPFTKVRRHRRQDGTPSRRRSESKVSTTTEGSISGTGSVADFSLANLAPSLTESSSFDIDDLLHASLLDQPDSPPTTMDDSTPQGPTSRSTKSFSDATHLTRWTRVPIGAFRSSMVAGGGEAALGSPGQMRGGRVEGLLGTGRSPAASRMLTSPVMGPVRSHKAKRQEKRRRTRGDPSPFGGSQRV